MNQRSKAWKFGNDIDTDQIIPARYLTTFERDLLAPHCMEDADTTFAQRVVSGDFIVAGKNFGCGSSREHAPLAILGAGVRAVIAESFARIFFRNCINLGLPIFECAEASRGIEQGDQLRVCEETGLIENTTRGLAYRAQPLPAFAKGIIDAGGLMKHVVKVLAARKRSES